MSDLISRETVIDILKQTGHFNISETEPNQTKKVTIHRNKSANKKVTKASTERERPNTERGISRTKKKCIDDRIMKEMHRGVTYWQGKGAYTNEDSLILVTVISKYEISQLKKIVKEIDPKAFIIFNDGMDVTGNFEKRL